MVLRFVHNNMSTMWNCAKNPSHVGWYEYVCLANIKMKRAVSIFSVFLFGVEHVNTLFCSDLVYFFTHKLIVRYAYDREMLLFLNFSIYTNKKRLNLMRKRCVLSSCMSISWVYIVFEFENQRVHI